MYAESTRPSAKRAMRMCPRSGQIFFIINKFLFVEIPNYKFTYTKIEKHKVKNNMYKLFLLN